MPATEPTIEERLAALEACPANNAGNTNMGGGHQAIGDGTSVVVYPPMVPRSSKWRTRLVLVCFIVIVGCGLKAALVFVDSTTPVLSLIKDAESGTAVGAVEAIGKCAASILYFGALSFWLLLGIAFAGGYLLLLWSADWAESQHEAMQDERRKKVRIAEYHEMKRRALESGDEATAHIINLAISIMEGKGVPKKLEDFSLYQDFLKTDSRSDGSPGTRIEPCATRSFS